MKNEILQILERHGELLAVISQRSLMIPEIHSNIKEILSRLGSDRGSSRSALLPGMAAELVNHPNISGSQLQDQDGNRPQHASISGEDTRNPVPEIQVLPSGEEQVIPGSEEMFTPQVSTTSINNEPGAFLKNINRIAPQDQLPETSRSKCTCIRFI